MRWDGMGRKRDSVSNGLTDIAQVGRRLSNYGSCGRCLGSKSWVQMNFLKAFLGDNIRDRLNVKSSTKNGIFSSLSSSSISKLLEAMPLKASPNSTLPPSQLVA
ncbi:predicted protein [Coccidioides posadasii str. Silveira]|uniref:Predicted protein n=2 Tax=Coccidioides posadasii TaxID=199306 RepID=E9D298_COCPS|nr:predicted protein [Coccidioides posadasii str. Silveira]KMM71771.1 hypothetical protein CPAG_08073 [Coccidioides posadasii RMSCC 3488]